mgnify:CR=1 FL=1
MNRLATNISEFNREFQLDLFNEIISDPKFGETVIESLDQKHFNVDVFRKIIHILKEYYSDHESILNFPGLKTEIDMRKIDEPLRSQLLDTVTEIESRKSSNKNVQIYVTKFCKLQNLKHALKEIDKKVERGVIDDYDHIEKVLKDALIFKDIEDSITLYHDIDRVISNDYREPIPTGIGGIDDIIGGGLAKGELALVIAPLGVGKTTFLTKVANTAYVSGRNVLQIFFEDKEKAIQRKHFAIMSQMPLSEMSNPDQKNVILQKINRAKERIGDNNNIFLQKLPADGVTVTKIKNIIKKLNARGHKIDLLILDYIDCVSPDKEIAGAEDWSNEGKIMRQLESVVEEMNVACWTATQGNRASTSVEVVKTDNMGGSLKKAQIAHFIMSIGKTLEQKEASVATIAILKNRLGADGMVFPNCKFDNSLLIIDTNDRITENGFEANSEKTRQQKNNKKYQELLATRDNNANNQEVTN